jgi:flagellar hook protein FlgE
MTISSSLNAGVAGLNAHAARLATISDNIANSATFGYKRVTTDFASMVTGGGASGRYSAGGVRTTTVRLVDERAPLIGTANPTDIAISGRGMLPVTSIAAAQSGGETPLMLTTTGSFRPDADGILRTASGLVLMGIPANADGTIPAFARDTDSALRPVRINAGDLQGNPTTAIDLGVNLPATATRFGEPADPIQLTVEYFTDLGMSDTISVVLTPQQPAAAGDPPTNTWQMVITTPAGPQPPVTLEFRGENPDAGTLLAPADPWVDLNVPGNNEPVRLYFGGADGNRGITQLSDRFAMIGIARDGAPIGNLVSVEVDERGMLNAIYDNGFVRTLYQIPVADVPNPNGLLALGNQAFRVSRESGPFFLWNAGEGPVGEMVGFAREESATDVAAELTTLIQTQRAYSSNAKVIQTVDEMLAETTNIKR